MSNKQYNLIMHHDPEFWSGNEGYVDFPKDRFLEYTDEHLKNQFQSLDQNAIITSLVDKGIVQEITGQKRDRQYAFAAYLKLLTN